MGPSRPTSARVESEPRPPTAPGAREATDDAAPDRRAEGADGPTAPVVSPAVADDAPPPERRVLGSIVAFDTRAALARHRVTFAPRSARTDTTTFTSDAEGRFVASLPYDEYRVTGISDRGSPEREGGLWVEPGRFHVLPAAGEAASAPIELTFVVRRAPRSLDVDVIDRTGAPAPDAVVEHRMVAYTAETPNGMRYMGHAATDARGRARFWLFSTDPADVTLAAFGADGDVSPAVHFEVGEELGVPLLQLGPPAWLDVTALWEQGGPAVDRPVHLRGPLGAVSERVTRALGSRRTDADGVARFGPVPAGEYSAAVENPRRSRYESSALLELTAGERTEVRLMLPTGERRVAASGVVRTSAGEPLGQVRMHWSTDGPLGSGDLRDPRSVESDAAGRFEIWALPSERIWLSLDVDESAEPFEPGSIDVPFGTDGLVFERRTALEERMFRIEVSDALTGERLEAYATFDRGPGTEAWSNTYAPRQVYVRRVPPGLRCRVGAEGYVSAAFDVGAALDASSSAPPSIRVELRRGLQHVSRVLDWESGLPLAGVRFRAPGAPDVLSDEHGDVHIEAEAWATYEVGKDGYESTTWDPSEYVLFDGGPLYLDRTP